MNFPLPNWIVTFEATRLLVNAGGVVVVVVVVGVALPVEDGVALGVEVGVAPGRMHDEVSDGTPLTLADCPQPIAALSLGSREQN